MCCFLSGDQGYTSLAWLTYVEGVEMTSLVEEIASLENEADSIVARARTEAEEMEKSAVAEVEAYRRKLAGDMEVKISAFQREMEEKHKVSVDEAERELRQALGTIDQIPDSVIKAQIDRIINRFSEL
jgi:hypothetical protein